MMHTLASVSPCTTVFVVSSNVTLCRTFTSSVPDSMSIQSVSVIYRAPFWSTACCIISFCIIPRQIYKHKHLYISNMTWATPTITKLRNNLLKCYYKYYGSIQHFLSRKSESISLYTCLIKYKMHPQAAIHLGMNSEVKTKQYVSAYMGHQTLLTQVIITVLLTQYLAYLTDIWVKYSSRFPCFYISSTDDDKLPQITPAIQLRSVHDTKSRTKY